MTTLKNHIKRLLLYLRINDKEGNLSVTNLLVLILLIKVTLAPYSDLDIVALAGAIFNYFGKKWLETP